MWTWLIVCIASQQHLTVLCQLQRTVKCWPAGYAGRLCSRTAGQQFTELYYYVIRSTDVYGAISPENLGNLSMHSQCIPGPLL